MKFVEKAGLPYDASHVVIGEKYYELLDKGLKKLGIEPVYVPDNPDVDPRLSGHADLSIFHFGGKDILLADCLRNSKFADKITEYGFNIRYSEIKQDKKYPKDAALNACALGKGLIYSENVTSGEIITEYGRREGSRLINTRQGYARCSVCIVNESSVISADRGIAEKCLDAGLDVLLISPGSVSLPGFDYGFLGGSTFKISENRLAFTGRLDKHPECEKILDFLDKKGVQPVFLSDEPIFDIGSGIPILEK